MKENERIYRKAKKRICRNIHSLDISDFDIIVELEKEIDSYRNKINYISENTFDVVASTNGLLIKNINMKTLNELILKSNKIR